MKQVLKNPILPGFYPDPSICRVGDDYYLATSSFSFYPGVPLFHSKDLCNWESIGYALDRPEQLRLNPDSLSGGIFAPTLRYHDGLFYLIVGNTTTGENILVTAKDPAGDWSEMHDIEGAGGDPSLFWDDDGSCWCSYSKMGGNVHGIVNRRLDLDTYQLVGEEYLVWKGNAFDAFSVEASHIYKVGDWYYLLASESGTEHYHAVTIARSKELNGTYENFRSNPILTHGNLTMRYPISNIGHADLVETQKGQWYMVVLGSRAYGGYHKNMGRETFITPVEWESGWPLASPETGKVEWEYEAPDLPPYPMAQLPEKDDFDAPALSWQWNTLGTPVNNVYRLQDSKLYIRTVAGPIQNEKELRRGPMPSDPEAFQKMQEERRNARSEALGFVGRRQQHISYDALAQLHYVPKDADETVGLVILQNAYNQIRVELCQKDGKQVAQVVKYEHINPNPMMGKILPVWDIQQKNQATVVGQREWDGTDLVLAIRARGQSNSFYIGPDEDHLLPVAENVDGSHMGSETAGGFVGAYIGMFASGNGQDTGNEAAFDWFIYRPVCEE